MNMTPQQLGEAIQHVKSMALLDNYARTLWSDLGNGRITEIQAGDLASQIEQRRRVVRGIDTVANRAPHIANQARAAGRISHFPPKRPTQHSRDREASRLRRYRIQASAPMPPQLAQHFTIGQQAALAIVVDAFIARGACDLPIDAIAARAGVCASTARKALRKAQLRGLLSIEERRQNKRPNLPNVVKIISSLWLQWTEMKKKTAQKKARAVFFEGGCKKNKSTDTSSYRTKTGSPFSTPPKRPFGPPMAVGQGRS